MSSPEFITHKVCFVDPATDRVRTYAQFAEDVDCPPVGDDLDSAYARICLIVSHIIRGNDVDVEQVRFETKQRILESGKGSTKGVGGHSIRSSNESLEPGASARPLTSSNESSVPGASALPLTDDWLQKIRGSKSRIRLATSGTTGQPKHVVHSVQSLTQGVRTGAHHENDVWGLAYPLDHLAGLQVLFQALFNRNTIVQLFGLPVDEIHQAIEQHGVTHLSCTPTFLKLLATDVDSHLAVKRLTTGGERSDTATLSVVKRIFPNARHRNIYALTETGNLLIADGDQFSVPIELHAFVKVIDGTLAIHRSLLADPTVATDDSDATSADWFLTGDLVETLVDQPLTFRFSARRDNIINVGGHKVIPQQVEECLMKLPSIRQAVVYGQKNSVTGQIVACDVVLEPRLQLDPASARQQLSEVLPRYAVPRIFNIVESVRMTPNGKLCRRSETS